MKYRNRKSIRLKNWDYSWEAYYYVTICTQKRVQILSKIHNKEIVLNIFGKLIEIYLNKLNDKFGVDINEYAIMPNHVHIIIKINTKGQTHGSDPTCHNNNFVGSHPCVRPELGDTIRWFKTMTTNEYIKLVKSNKMPTFEKRIWQRNYYEHIIRNENEYLKIKKYIQDNPVKWNIDKNNPINL